MRLDREKKYSDINYYYIILISIMMFGYTIRSSIFDGIIGYINIISYLCMAIILFKHYKNIDKSIFIVIFIMLYIISIDIATNSKIDSIARSLIAFVLPLAFLCIDHNRIIKNKEEFIIKFLKIFNALVIILFIYMLIDGLSGCYLTKIMSNVFDNLKDYVPKNTGFLKYRSKSFLGHQLYTKHFILMFYLLNMIYFVITSKSVMNIGLIHIISVLSILMSGSKTALVVLFILVLFFNIRGPSKYRKMGILIIAVIIMYFMGLFDYIINRFMTTSLTTGRSVGWRIVSEGLPNVKIFSGQGENLFKMIENKFTDTQITAAFEYPIRILSFRYGILVTSLIMYLSYFKSLFKFLKDRCIIIVICFLLVIGETNTFNQLVFNPDFMILIVLWNIVFMCMFEIWKDYKDNNYINDYKDDKISLKEYIKKLKILFNKNLNRIKTISDK